MKKKNFFLQEKQFSSVIYFVRKKGKTKMTNFSKKDSNMEIKYSARLNSHIMFGNTLDVLPTLLHHTDKTNMFIFNCYGVEYKHMDKIKFSVIDGSIQSLEMDVQPADEICPEPCLQVQIIPESDIGSLEITDTFNSYVLTWEKNDKHIILKHENESVMIDYQTGEVNIVNVESNLMMIDFYNLCKTHSTNQKELDRLNKLIAKLQKEISYN